eukprot:scaffold2670_cov19-Tisochrysis_lutea.AAC.1
MSMSCTLSCPDCLQWDCAELRFQLFNALQEIVSVMYMDFVSSDMRAEGSDEEIPEEPPGPRWSFNAADCVKQRAAKGMQNLKRFRDVCEGNMHMIQRDQMPQEFEQ